MDDLKASFKPVADGVKEKVAPLFNAVTTWARSVPAAVAMEPVSNQTAQSVTNAVSQEMVQDNETRRILIAKLISTGISLVASVGISYVLVKIVSSMMDPTRKEKTAAKQKADLILKKLGVTGVQLSAYELCIAANLVDPVTMEISWDDIGGLEDIIEQIKETVIFPLRNRGLFLHSKLLQPPKGMLLYGPPGCGKTMIAKATAKAAGCRFINLQISSLVDKWYGESQKLAAAVFSLAIKLQPSIIFIDEIDSFLRSRKAEDHEATAMMKTQFMSLWDGIITDPTCQIMIVGATNRPQDLDAAILRRLPCQFKIGTPGKDQRKHIMRIILEDEEVEELDFNKLGGLTDGFSGSDLKEACRQAAFYRVREVLEHHRNIYGADALEIPANTNLREMSMSDLEYGINQVRDSKKLLSGSLIQTPLLD